MADSAGVSFEDMMGAPSDSTQPSSALPGSAVTADQMLGGGISADEMLGGAPAAPAKPSAVLEAVGAGASKYWTDYVKLSNEYAESLKADSKANPQGLAEEVVQSGKTLLHLLGAAFSPLESAARTGIIEPVQSGVQRMSELAAQHLASPDVYNAQERRERWMMGAPVQQQYPGGVDWHIHQADVQRTAEGLNQFIETGVLTATGFIGGESPAAAVSGEAGSARLPVANMIRMDASAAAVALKGLKEISTGALEKFPALKDSVLRLTDNIKQLAIRDPNAVEDLAAHVAPADPEVAQQLKKISSEAQTLTPEAQEAFGKKLAKPRLRVVGTAMDGKPILRLVPPEQGIAGAVDEGYKSLKTPSTTPPEVVAAANKAYNEQLLREEAARPADNVALGWSHVGEAPTTAEREFAKDWGNLQRKMQPRYIQALETGRPIGAHAILDTMISEAGEASQAEFLRRLRTKVDDVPVSYKNELRDYEGNLKPRTLGHYLPLSHSIEVRTDPFSSHMTHTTLHEIVHASTVNWMRYNETHPLMKELNSLYHYARDTLKIQGERGMANTEEFVAEAFTNPSFQKKLSRGRMYSTTVFSHLASILSKVFGLGEGSTNFMSKVMNNVEGIMKEQKRNSDRMTGRAAAAEMTEPGMRWKQVGTRPDGKPVMRQVPDDTVVFNDHGIPVTRSAVTQAFQLGERALDKIPGMPVVMGKLKEYYSQIIQTFNPEAGGPEARAAAAVLAKRIAISMQRDSAFVHQSAVRRGFWNHRVSEQPGFIKAFEKGEKLSGPLMEQAALAYRVWNERILNQDLKNKLEYEPVDNYLYHTFKDSDGVAAFLTQRFGSKWNNPKFIKERSFEMYDQAVAAGFKPKFTNPEDIMLARQHASDVAQMRIDVLKDLERFGLATEIKANKNSPEGFPATEWRAPNGDRYWVHNTASSVMHNAFNTKSLWTMPGIGGDAFRGAMFLKNAIVPIKLAMSLFHPIHVATIDNATAMTRASKELLSGTMPAGKFFKEMTKATLYLDAISAPKAGYRILKAYQGRLKEGEFTETDTHALRLMAEGGFIPEMSSQYRTQAWDKFKDAIQQRSLTAVWHLPFAAVDLLQKPMFQVWIPSLKIASYLKDVQSAFRTDPTLLNSPLKRQVALRKISKSVDNRYGEMAYNTLFWNRWVKDLAVANTLSLGWQMGFIREYGGGALDLGQFATKQGTVLQKIKSGMLDRPLFVGFYTTQALAYGGLMTWALTGKSPQDLIDYIYPQNGEEDANGAPQRVTTMFYPREFAAIYKHMENEGVVSGLGHLAASKASGVIGLTSEWATGVNSFGQEIRDPSASGFKQLQQTLAYTLSDLEPISINAIRGQVSQSPAKTTAMAIAGFGPAPKYVTESRTEAGIKTIYQKYYAQKQTPFEKAEFSNESRQLKRYWDSGDQEKFGDLMDQMQEKFDLTGKEMKKLQSKIQGQGDPLGDMFSRMTWQQQKRLLDQMTEDERAVYLPRSNRDHLRFNYEPPEQ